jgi:hypothetical protein
MRSACFRLLLLIAIAAATSPARAESPCMYGADGSVVYRPAGAECRDVAQTAAKEADFVAPRPAQDGPWLEIRPGDEHLFAVQSTRGQSNHGNPMRYTSYKGTQHRVVVAGPERFGKASMERRLTLRVAEGGQSLDQTDLQRDFIRLTGNGYQLLAMNRFWYFKRQDVDLGDGSYLLPAKIERGAKWVSGRIRDDFFKVDETGEVIDLQNVVTPAGTFENCLHVRYTGVIGSHKTRLDGRSAAMGKYVRDAWYARGVGLVKEAEDGRVEAFWQGDSFSATSKWEAAIKGVKRASMPAKQR